MAKKIILFALFSIAFLLSCSSVKVLNSWKADNNRVDEFKKKKVLVIARTADDDARMAFEIELADQLRSQGVDATESYIKAPKIHPNKEITKERVEFMREIMGYEGFDAVVITVIRNKEQTTSTVQNGVYFGSTYSNYYPDHYGNFYTYYSYPYASYYDSFGGFIPTSTSTRTSSNYVLETIAYNLEEAEGDQIVAVITTKLENPKEAYKAAEKYIAEIVKSFE